jgi:hypothetical protein
MEGTLIAVEVTKIATLQDGSVTLSINTQELSPGKAAELFALRKKVCYAYFSASQIENNEKKMVDSLDPELKGKTPGQRLRNVLYRCWEQNPEGYQDSDSYYKSKMESIITTYKANLE